MGSDYFKNVDFPIDDNPLWKVYENNYDNYYLNYKKDKTPRIPKKIHQIWLGGELPIKYFRLIRTWIDKHPEWDYKLWTDKDVESFGMVNKKLFDAVENKGLKSDIFRYEILYRHGGLYMDTDFRCIKPFDDLMYLDFFAGNGHTTHPYVNCCLFATYPKNPLLLKIINDLTPKINTLPTPGHYGEIMSIMGADFFAKEVNDYIQNTKDKIVIFPKNFFYPFPPELRNDVAIQKNRDLSKPLSFVKDVTYCVHLWFTSWQWQTQIIEEDEQSIQTIPNFTVPSPSVPSPQKNPSRVTGEVTLTQFLRKLGGG